MRNGKNSSSVADCYPVPCSSGGTYSDYADPLFYTEGNLGQVFDFLAEALH